LGRPAFAGVWRQPFEHLLREAEACGTLDHSGHVVGSFSGWVLLAVSARKAAPGTANGLAVRRAGRHCRSN
jgi:membrane associated rhomboid family serine protease